MSGHNPTLEQGIISCPRCKGKGTVRQMSELAAPTLLSCDLAARMEEEARQFGECARHHGLAWNRSAEAVALRAQEILLRFAAEVKQDNK